MPREIYREDQPPYAGGTTFCRCPLVELDEVRGDQVVVVGVPVDEGTSVRPGARFGPRAIRLADDGNGPPQLRRHLDTGVYPFRVLDVVDAGDLAVVAGDPAGNLRLAEDAVRQIVAAGATPVVLGGDHSIAGATIRGAVAEATTVAPHVIQLDAHTDTAPPGAGRPWWSHGSPMWRLVNDAVITGSQLSQIGLRGWWPGAEALAWAERTGVRCWTARQLRQLGTEVVAAAALEAAPADAPIWLSVDIDVVDPAFAPGTGTPEPGGITSAELLDLVATLAGARRLLGCELVEVAPAYDADDITALLAHRAVLETLSAVAKRTADEPEPKQ